MFSDLMRRRGVRLSLPLLIGILLIDPLLTLATTLKKFHQVSMGTVIEITLLSEEEEASRRASHHAFEEVKRIEALMSPWLETSDLWRLNRSSGKQWVKVSPETLTVIKAAQTISELSRGSFDITVAPLIALWKRSIETRRPPSFEEVKALLPLVNFRNILIDLEGNIFLKKEGMAIDLGGIAKGYAVDRASERLVSLGFHHHIINAGGDLKVKGFKKNQLWSIGIQHPRESGKILTMLSTSDAAIATSGDYEKFFIHQDKRYHHLLNPKTGFPAEGCQSVTVLGKEAMTADAMATAIFVLGPQEGYVLCQTMEEVECLIVDREGRPLITPGLKERIPFYP